MPEDAAVLDQAVDTQVDNSAGEFTESTQGNYVFYSRGGETWK